MFAGEVFSEILEHLGEKYRHTAWPQRSADMGHYAPASPSAALLPLIATTTPAGHSMSGLHESSTPEAQEKLISMPTNNGKVRVCLKP